MTSRSSDLIAEAKRLLKDISPNGWDRGPYQGHAIHIIEPTDEPFVARTVATVPVTSPSYTAYTDQSEEVAQFIAAAPRLVRDLLTLLSSQEQALSQVIAEMQKYMQHVPYCDITIWEDTHGATWRAKPECNCGLSTLLAGSPQAQEQKNEK